eukprot:g31240.t1
MFGCLRSKWLFKIPLSFLPDQKELLQDAHENVKAKWREKQRNTFMDGPWRLLVCSQLCCTTQSDRVIVMSLRLFHANIANGKNRQNGSERNDLVSIFSTSHDHERQDL